MKVLVCGGRDFDDWDTLYAELSDLFYNRMRDLSKPFVVISGDAKGADWLARAWAKYMSIEYPVEYRGFPADWKTHGKSAGAIRNQSMIDEGSPDFVLAFPGGRGTADMVSRAKKTGIPVKEVKPKVNRWVVDEDRMDEIL